MNEAQWITLRDVFREHGLNERAIEDVFLLLSYKPERVQIAFYRASLGDSYAQIADRVGVTKMQAWKDVNEKCSEIHKYFSRSIFAYTD